MSQEFVEFPTKLLQELRTTFEELQRLDKLQEERSAAIASLAKRARQGEKITEAERRQTFDNTVVDYGDVWESLKRLAPRVLRIPLRRRKSL